MNREGCANELGCEFSWVEEKFAHIVCQADETSKQDHRISWLTFGMAEIIPNESQCELLFDSFGVQAQYLLCGGKDRERKYDALSLER
jgi:hypothetical protein